MPNPRMTNSKPLLYVFFFLSAFLITLKCLVLEKFWTIRSLQSSAVIYLLFCSPPGIVKVMIHYNSSKCMESFCGGDTLNISSLQDFSTVLFWMCSMKLIDPVSWISHWKTFAGVSVNMLKPIYCDWKLCFSREKRSICSLDVLLWMRAQIWILNL